ncbi:hypothetical protein T492DRAFT_840584 [Pavlovales sp. CCMP2436]|nr:hypothetical protein T492DRAFT_840584 [Pavlovales sp. CCMP2436]
MHLGTGPKRRRHPARAALPCPVVAGREGEVSPKKSLQAGAAAGDGRGPQLRDRGAHLVRLNDRAAGGTSTSACSTAEGSDSGLGSGSGSASGSASGSGSRGSDSIGNGSGHAGPSTRALRRARRWRRWVHGVTVSRSGTTVLFRVMTTNLF